ncbi:MAG TPA: hypothetical protein VMY42_03375 [Thermoguttaceae bacterium]|nr:hypothetical protein [Thermoguttaceae bacterium]
MVWRVFHALRSSGRATLFASRSQAVQVALREMIVHRKRHRLAEECSKLDPAFEQAMAEEGLSEPLADY